MGVRVPHMPPPAPPRPDTGWYHDHVTRQYVNEYSGERVPYEAWGSSPHHYRKPEKVNRPMPVYRPTNGHKCGYCRTLFVPDGKGVCQNCGAGLHD